MLELHVFFPMFSQQVQSDSDQDLMIDSDQTVTLQGSEGLDVNSKQIDMQADVIELRSVSINKEEL